MSLLVVVQARVGSSRFPGKVLADIAGQPMLAFMLDRICPLIEDPGTALVVATSDRSADDEVATIANTKGIAAVRGSERDVLARFRLALSEHPADLVVRLTADCPLIDVDVIRRVVAEHESVGADYTSNTLARTFPDGLDVEVLTSDALVWVSEHAERADEREHVTPHLQRHPRTFQLSQVLDEALAGDERWTVDRPEDLEVIIEAVTGFDDPVGAGWTELLQLLGRRHPSAAFRALPVATTHLRGAPFHRRWTVTDGAQVLGSALVVVDDGGQGTLQIEGSQPDKIEAAIEERLKADLQVTSLTKTNGATT